MTLPDTLESIDHHAFYGFDNIVSLEPALPASVTNLGTAVFYGWSKFNQPFVIPDGLTALSDSLFEGWVSFDQPFEIPESVRYLGSRTFRHWRKYNQPFSIPSAVQGCLVETFEGWVSFDKPFVIPSGVTYMDGNALIEAVKCPYVLFEGAVPLFNNMGGLLYTFWGDPIYSMAEGFATWVRRDHLASWNAATAVIGDPIEDGEAMFDSFPIRVVEQQVTYMVNDAFYADALFTNVLFNGGSAVIDPPANPVAPTAHVFGGWKYANDDPFDNGNPDSDRDVVVYASFDSLVSSPNYWVMNAAGTHIEHYTNYVKDGWALAVSVDANGEDLTILSHTTYPTSSGNSSGNTAPLDAAITLPLGDPMYANDLLSDRYLVAIGITGSSLSWSPFYTMTGVNNAQTRITALTLPDTLVTIGNNVFSGWSIFNDATFTTIPPNVTVLGRGVFGGWSAYNQPFTWPAHLSEIPYMTFADWKVFNQPFEVPNSVTTIGQGAFCGWSIFNNSFTLPDTITTLRDSVFQNWTSFNQSFTVPGSVTRIEAFAFQGWQSFNKPFTLPNSVDFIDTYAFYGWQSCSHPFVVPESVMTMGEGIFLFGKFPYVLFENECPVGMPLQFSMPAQPPFMISGFMSWMLRGNLESWNASSRVSGGLIEDGTAIFSDYPIRVVEQMITLDAGDGSVNPGSVLYTNQLFAAANKTTAYYPTLPDAEAPAGYVFTGWTNSNGTVFMGGEVDKAADFTLYACYAFDSQDYRVMVTAIEVDPETMDVRLEWDVTPFVPGSVVIEKTQIRFADTLSDSDYGLSAWLDLRNNALRTAVEGDEIGVTVKTANVTHAATILGAYIADFKLAHRDTDDETCGFFYVIVNGVLKE